MWLYKHKPLVLLSIQKVSWQEACHQGGAPVGWRYLWPGVTSYWPRPRTSSLPKLSSFPVCALLFFLHFEPLACLAGSETCFTDPSQTAQDKWMLKTITLSIFASKKAKPSFLALAGSPLSPRDQAWWVLHPACGCWHGPYHLSPWWHECNLPWIYHVPTGEQGSSHSFRVHQHHGLIKQCHHGQPMGLHWHCMHHWWRAQAGTWQVHL